MKTILQMSEITITPLSKKVPRGYLSELARECGWSWTTMQAIADGENKNHPKVYSRILKEAIRYKKELQEKAELEKQNQELASQL